MSEIFLRSLVFTFVLAFAGCSRDGASGALAAGNPTTTAAESASASIPLVAPYPLGRWRLGDRQQLENVILWPSHILIRHAGSKNDEVSFNLATWNVVPPPPTRTRAEALALAEDVARQARQSPERFAALAAEYSEDLTTKDHGGSLGGVAASQLTPWPQVVDALAAIAPGQPSKVVETWYGFHVLIRSAPPPDQRVSGAQIVIGHEQAPWLAFLARGALPHRTREEARALAAEVYEQARRQPKRFAELVERYSEHRSAAIGGDIGSYSTTAPSLFPRQVEVLAKLKVGDIAPPIESLVGFEIMQRTPDRPRKVYAMDSLWLPFSPEAPDTEPMSRAMVLAQARAYIAEIGGDPQRFDALQRTVCCSFVQQWEQGRAAPALASVLDGLENGQIAIEPVQAEFYYVIAKRIGPTIEAPKPSLFTLPEPDQVDLDYQIGALQAPFADALLRRVGEKAEALFTLDPGKVGAYRRSHELGGRLSDTASTEERQAVLASLLTALRAVLDDQQYATYQAVMQREFHDYLLNPANETAIARLQ